MTGGPVRVNRRTVMRGSLTITAGAVVGAHLAGCGDPGVTGPSSSGTVTTPERNTGVPQNALLAYFSRAGENYHYGGRIDLEIGNTQVLAQMIAAAGGAVDVYRIEAAEPYPQSYEETVERNRQEQRSEARPAIAGVLPTIEQYDTVLLGSPLWNVRPPMIMRTFVDSVNLRGRVIHPFVTYAVSGIGGTIDDYTRLCPESVIGEGLAVRGEEVRMAGPDVTAWLQRAGFG